MDENSGLIYVDWLLDRHLTGGCIYLQDAAMVLEEQPGKVAEAVKLFLQGLGYTTVRGKVRSASLANTPIKKATKRPTLDPQQQPQRAEQTAELIEGLQELVLSQQVVGGVQPAPPNFLK